VIRILLAEDVHMVRGALLALLALEQDLTVVADVADGDSILPTARRHRPDVAIIDIDLPGKDGITAATELRTELPDCKILILTGLGRPGTVRRALSARVDGFLLKDAPPARLAQAVRDVAAGRRVVDGEVALAAWESPDCPLTRRETEILRLTADGAEVGEIAEKLFLSAGTVRNYLTTIVSKLNARTRVDAARLARDAGWI
jgi:two-component system response regulator DesR